MTPSEIAIVIAAGLGAGVLTSTVGVASLLSFPLLLAIGLPPVTANASNTVGLTPGALSGAWGYRRELRAHLGVFVAVLITCGLGAIVGALALIALPPGVFELVVPWLILFTCLLVGAQPWISKWVRRRHGDTPPEPRTRMSPVTVVFSTLTGVYGGYFGAGSGVMMTAVLGLGLDIEFRYINALKTVAVFASNLVASVLFVFIADLDWPVIALLAAGSIVGGYVGSRIGRVLPAPLLRVLIVVAGVVAAVLLLR